MIYGMLCLTCSNDIFRNNPEVMSFCPISKLYRAFLKISPFFGSNSEKMVPALMYKNTGTRLRHFNFKWGTRRENNIVHSVSQSPCSESERDLDLNWENCKSWTSSENGLKPLWNNVVFCMSMVDPAVAKLTPWLKFAPMESRYALRWGIPMLSAACAFHEIM